MLCITTSERIRMVKNKKIRLKIIKKTFFLSCVREAHVEIFIFDDFQVFAGQNTQQYYLITITVQIPAREIIY